MKTKQSKEELDKNIEEDITKEPKTRARKKASDTFEEDKNKSNDEPKTSKDPKKTLNRPRAIIKKKPLGIKKTVRGKKAVVQKDKLKKVLRKAVTRGRKPAVRTETEQSQEKETTPLILPSEIKKEPVDDTTPNSRSSSPKTAGRRQRLSSDMVMMKSVLGDSPSTLVVGPRTSPYSMRSERGSSPSMYEGKKLRSGKPRKIKNILLNEIVKKEQKKRHRLPSDSKLETGDIIDEAKKLKRGRSCSRDGSEISKCSDITESDISLSEGLNDTDIKELNKKVDKSKTDLDLDFENNVQISTIENVPSLNTDSKLALTKLDTDPNCLINEKDKKSLNLKRSTSLDSDNNNSNRLNLDNLTSSDIEDKLLVKTENDALSKARSSILTSMSKTFNSKEMSKNIRKARRGRKAAAASRPNPNATKTIVDGTLTTDTTDDKQETLETLSKEIDDLINNLDQNIDSDRKIVNEMPTVPEKVADENQSKTVSKFYGLSKPLGDNNSISTQVTSVKDKIIVPQLTNENTTSKDDGENMKLHYEEDTMETPSKNPESEKNYNVLSIDKLMGRLKEFEEFDKKRQRQESESKPNDNKPVMVTNDVVLIPKSGADIKPLKDIQSMRSPERPIEKENVLSCFENNSAISIVKRDQARKSVDIDLPNSVTLIKRNSVSARKESTSSNHSREADAISIFEKSLGKDVTLTEIRKSVEKPVIAPAVDLQQLAVLHPNTPSLAGVVIDSSQISITPRVMDIRTVVNDTQVKRKSLECLSVIKATEANEAPEEKMATLEKIQIPLQISSSVSITPTAPVAIKSPEAALPIDTEALAPPLENVKDISDNISQATEINKIDADLPELVSSTKEEVVLPEASEQDPVKDVKICDDVENTTTDQEKEIDIPLEHSEIQQDAPPGKIESESLDAVQETPEKVHIVVKVSKSARNSIENQPGPSSMLHETPESQKRKENILRTLGLLTHKAAKEAKIEKQKEKERIYNTIVNNKNKTAKVGSGDYTGTLKTVIKLNRGTGDRERKKYRSSLKMTFQKSKNRSGKLSLDVGELANEDDAYYTIEKREIGAATTSDGGHRKSHYSNRLNNHDAEAAPVVSEPAEGALHLVIPEKASSFSIHPGRLCRDQCFYCGGKFGLFDTPCHIAQMKSSERQKKVLDNEEKLTIDSCLCDACYRHVDRRANCPSYRQRPLKQPTDQTTQPTSPPNTSAEKPSSPPLEEESDEEGGAGEAAPARFATCHAEGCVTVADQSIRRKWLMKMRTSVNKVVKLQGDYPGLHTIPLCGVHYTLLAPLMTCALCRRRLTKHHNLHFALQSYSDVNPLLAEVGLPVQFTERPMLCKMCRYYCTLLQRPGYNDHDAKRYTRKLLQVYNIEVPPESEVDAEDAVMSEDLNNSKHKKKARKSKQRKSSEPDKPDSECSEKTNESPEKDKVREESNDSQMHEQPLEEDIESLISSNKILVPGAKAPSECAASDGSDEHVLELESAAPPFDKQTELQYLLQKQNNPAQFLHKPNLTKQKNIFKIQNVAGVQKPAQQHKINDKNAKRLHKIGQAILHKDKPAGDVEMLDTEKVQEVTLLKNITLNDECTIETIPNKKSAADINTLKNKWQMSESFTQVKKNLSELSKKLTTDKEPKRLSDVKYTNPVKRLETNPSISVRELFPGEEEMSLQCSIEFNNVKGVTPEGWEKCSSVIQYDVETKKLWSELQRPYGNQSSFLRHLILLEKYFRSGDLVLAPAAAPAAVSYSDSAQTRLRAYDNVPSEPARRTDVTPLIEYRKKPSVNGKSLLKSNQEKDPKKAMPPPGTAPKPKPKMEKAKSKPLPPELIAINTPNVQGRKAIQNVLHNIQQLVKGVSASDPTEVAAAPLLPHKFDPPKDKKEPPKADTPKKQKSSSKPWRPKLMPITPENLAKIAREPTQVAVDGRNLPSLVQVMSSGKRYHITRQDYNKMCIMRREKLQQLQETETKTKRLSVDETTVVTEIQTSNILGNGGTLVQNLTTEKDIDKPKDLPDVGQVGSNAANILKNVGLKNITIAPIPAKTATITSQTLPIPIASTSSLLVTSSSIKIPQLGPAVSITSETVPNLPIMSTSHMVMPKIPKSLTVIPQTVVSLAPALSPAVMLPAALTPLADPQRP